MNNSRSELFAVRFADAVAGLKRLGIVCDVAVNAGLVIVSTTDKSSAQTLRAACKRASKAHSTSVFVETRPTKGAYVFTIFSGV
jgi:hypothetical protein